MLAGLTIATAMREAGFSHVVWIPDSHLGTWDAALVTEYGPNLLRVTREGEAVGLAAGLMLGRAKPLVLMQCTGFFEAGDAIRNVAHDLKLPLKMLVGVRSWRAFQSGSTTDTCPAFTEPIVDAWQLPRDWFDPVGQTEAELTRALLRLNQHAGAAVLLWEE
jgi:sulfopyruvate decarboxylase TPP-binding subunit